MLLHSRFAMCWMASSRPSMEAEARTSASVMPVASASVTVGLAPSWRPRCAFLSLALVTLSEVIKQKGSASCMHLFTMDIAIRSEFWTTDLARSCACCANVVSSRAFDIFNTVYHVTIK